jgi:hypothetical protein
VTQEPRDVTRALPAWANPRWATDDPALWAACLYAGVRVVRWQEGGPYSVVVQLATGEWAELDAKIARALLALLVSAGGV